MAAASSPSLNNILTYQHQYHHHHLLSSSTRHFLSPFLPRYSLSKSSSFHHHPFLSLQTSNSQTKSIPPSTDSFPATPPPSPTPVITTTSSFIDPDSIRKLQRLEDFTYTHEFDHGSLRIRLMAPEEVDETVLLLSESFAESMWMPKKYVTLLAFLVKQYVMEKRTVLPHAATIVGFYKGKGEEEKLACTAEISFDVLGMNASPHTPLSPRECPYICNMAVNKELRRKGIGWHLLKACESLISLLSVKQEVYLHCRLIDQGPLNMYKKAGYQIVKKDNILAWLTLQRRKNLMCKNILRITVETDDSSVK